MDVDIAIIGAGPAGLSAGYTAVKNGASVVVLEKSNEIGYPIHTTGGSWVKEMKMLGIDDSLFHPIKKCLFISPNEKAEFTFGDESPCVLDVRGLYQYLAEKAAKAGAKIFVNSKVSDILVENDFVKGLKVKTINGDIQINAKITIDASGFTSFGAKKAGIHAGFKRFAVGAEYDLYAPNYNQDEAILIVGNQIAPAGYGWLFPRGNNRVRVGVGIIKPDSKEDPKKYLDKLIYDFGEISESLANSSQIEYHYGIIPSERLLEDNVSDGLIVAGDSGGQINALAGEGIRYAMIFGSFAGEVASEAIMCGNYSRDFLKKYSDLINKYQRNIELSYKINYRLARYPDSKWDEKISMLNQLNGEQFMEFLKGDFSAGLLLNILSKNPSYLSSKIKTLPRRFMGRKSSNEH